MNHITQALPTDIALNNGHALDALRHVPALSACTEETLRALLQNAYLEELPKNRLFLIHGDKAENYFVVLKGWVKLFRETLDGAQAITDIVPKNCIFGETALFGDGTYSFSAETVDECVLMRLSIDTLRTRLEEDPALALAMLKNITNHSHQQEKELEHRTLQNAPQRIGCFLLRLLNPQTTEGSATLNLPYDKALLATRLGMQPETFSRALQRLKDENVLRITGAQIEISNIEQLSHYVCSACSASFPCKDL